MNQLDISAFQNGKNFISLGKIDPEIVSFLTEKVPQLSDVLTSDSDILFWKDRIKHTEQHKDDFMSDTEFYNCLASIPSIIAEPDYLSVHPKDNSISFIKDFSSHVSVAVRVSASGNLSYRTMYPIMDAQLSDYIEHNRAWRWNK
jgi:hypothetical protein